MFRKKKWNSNIDIIWKLKFCETIYMYIIMHELREESSYFWNIILTLKYTQYKHENQLNINTHIYMNIPRMAILLIKRLLLLDSFDKQIVKKFKLSHTANVIVNIKLNIKKPQRMINTLRMWYNRSNQENMKDCCNYKNW